MMSHLPKSVLGQLASFTQGVDDGLQADGHKVSVAMAVAEAFDQGYVGSPLQRSLICAIGAEVARANNIPYLELANGGFELRITDDAVERRFRMRKARFDKKGFLDVKVSSDSFLTARANDVKRTLFDQDQPEGEQIMDQWVLAYLLDPATLTIRDMYAAYPVGVVNDYPPYRLAFGDVVRVPINAPTPPSFSGSTDDLDLDLGDEEQRDEEGNEGAA